MSDRLVQRFGKSKVFLDIHSIEGGEEFARVIADHLNSSRVLLVAIGPGWKDARSQSGQRRLDEANDYVRREIEIGLSLDDCYVVPVLFNGAETPTLDDIPPSIASLVNRHAFRVRNDSDFDNDLQQLSRFLEKHVQPKAKWPLPAAIFALIVILSYFLWNYWPEQAVVIAPPEEPFVNPDSTPFAGCIEEFDVAHRFSEIIILNHVRQPLYVCTYPYCPDSVSGSQCASKWTYTPIDGSAEQVLEKNWRGGCKYVAIYDPKVKERVNVGWVDFGWGESCEIEISQDIMSPDTDPRRSVLIDSK